MWCRLFDLFTEEMRKCVECEIDKQEKEPLQSYKDKAAGIDYSS